MARSADAVRVAVYGCGRWANRTHIPNLMQIEGAEVVALCDVDPQALGSTAAAFAIPGVKTFRNAHAMLAEASFDALFSVVRARHRTDVEIRAAEQGCHLFSEKPQAETLGLARRIDDAVRQAGVLSTVGFRERYRPLFQRARDHLLDKTIVQATFRSVYGLRAPRWTDADTASPEQLPEEMLMSWGVHAVDYIRFLTGLDLTRVAGFEHQPPPYLTPIAQSLHAELTTGAPVSVIFVQAAAGVAPNLPAFDLYYEGGTLSLRRQGTNSWSLSVDGVEIARDSTFDPWLAQDRCFIEAIHTGDRRCLLNDYHDGLASLAPVLRAQHLARVARGASG